MRKRMIKTTESAPVTPVKMNIASMGWRVYQDMRRNFFSGAALEGSDVGFVRDILANMTPRDAMEEMLIMQAIWTHARIAHLSLASNQQKCSGPTEKVNQACDRAANTFRRQMQALFDYRNPRRSDTFLAIKQANLAQQQVVQNAQGPQRANFDESARENARQVATPALPADAGRPQGPAGMHAPDETLDALHRTENAAGQSDLADERLAPRPAQCQDPRRDA